MTATGSALEGWIGNGAALSFVVEGFGTAFATDVMNNTYTADAPPYNQWDDPTGGMKIGGLLTGSIKLYTPDINPDTITVSIVDSKSLLIGSLFRENSSAGHTTYLTSSVAAGSTATINVADTTGFAASGTIYIGGEAISYSAKTGTAFTVANRALNAINQTDSGAAFAPSHLIGNNVVVGARTAPAVTDFPRTWYGRFCHLFLHVKDPLTGAYNVPSVAKKVITGRIELYSDDGDGTITITIKTALDLLYKQIGPDQWRARLNAGGYLDGTSDVLMIAKNSAAASYNVTKALGLSGVYTHDVLAADINARIVTNTWDTELNSVAITAGDVWSIDLIETGDGGPARYRMSATKAAKFGSEDKLSWGMHPLALELLGFLDPGAIATSQVGSAGQSYSIIDMQPIPNASGDLKRFEAIAPKPPIIYRNETPSMQQAIAKLIVSDEVNTFVSQTATDFTAWPDANGAIQIKGGKFDSNVYAVIYTNGAPSIIQPHAILDQKTGYFKNVPTGYEDTAVRLGDDGAGAPEVRQVFYYRGPAGTLLLQLLLSSGGASGYNHATYDTITTSGFGAGVPASLVDVVSWEALNAVQISVVVNDPKPLYEYIEPILAVSGHYVVWKAATVDAQPKLTVVKPSLDSIYQTTWHMTESNKADNARTKVDRALDGIINRIVVKYGSGITGNKDAASTLTVEDIPSQTDYGRRRTITIDAGPVVNVHEVASQTIGPALAYFARPVATLERSYNASLMRMAPGDSVTLTDSNVVDAATGTRGATLYCWCLDTRFDLATGKGAARLVYLPEKNVNYTGMWAPSARVDETASTGGYVVGTKVLTLRAHEYTEATSATADATFFKVGDKVRVLQIDASVPITWTDTIAAQSGNTATLTTGDGGLWDATKRYVLIYGSFAVAQTAQKQSAFCNELYEWGHRPSVTLIRTPTYTQGMPRRENGVIVGIPDAPIAVNFFRDLARGCNNFLGYRSRSTHLNGWLGDLATAGTSSKLQLLVWVPFYGHVSSTGTRDLKFRIRGRQTGGGTATFVINSSPMAPTGSSSTSFSFPTGRKSATFTTASATNIWSAETTLPAAPSASGPDGMFGTWISIYSFGSGGGITATFNQIFVCEAGL